MEQKKTQSYYDVSENGRERCYYGTDAELVGQLSRVEDSDGYRYITENSQNKFGQGPRKI